MYKYENMKILKYILSSFFLALTATCSVHAQQEFKKLVWSDEFNYTGAPDSTKWKYQTGRGCPDNCGWGNNELEYYTKDAKNSVVENGILKIRSAREEREGALFTSGKLVTKGLFEFTYGRVEVRAKLPAEVGSWPAIWMLGTNIDSVNWPRCGEIDIMEHRGKDLNLMFGTLHYPGHSGDNADGNKKMFKNISTELHIYSLEWSAASIKMLVDGVIVHEVANNNNLPFNHDFFLILNLAMGGNFAGPIDAAVNGAEMQVDYVRVYQ